MSDLRPTDGLATVPDDSAGKELGQRVDPPLEQPRPETRSDLFVYHRDKRAARTHFLKEQRGRCAICGNTESVLFLDHEHSPLELCRGLLCPACNSGLGFFLDHPGFLKVAARYIQEHAERNAAYRETEDWQARQVKIIRSRLDPESEQARNERIVRLIEAGEPSSSIAKRYGLSISQVNRIYLHTEASDGGTSTG